MNPKYSYTLWNVCQADNSLYDYPNNVNTNQLGETANEKTLVIGAQSLQNKKNQNVLSIEEYRQRIESLFDWGEMVLRQESLEKIRTIVGHTKEEVTTKTMVA